MSEPVIELIAKNIETTINAVTTANGYNQDLTAVRPKRTDFLESSWNDLTVLITQAEVEKIVDVNSLITWRQHFVLVAIVIDSDTASDSIDTRENAVRSDIEKKLTEDITRGGYAYDTGLLGAVPFKSDDGANSGIAIEFTVDYRTLGTDPYTQA